MRAAIRQALDETLSGAGLNLRPDVLDAVAAEVEGLLIGPFPPPTSIMPEERKALAALLVRVRGLTQEARELGPKEGHRRYRLLAAANSALGITAQGLDGGVLGNAMTAARDRLAEVGA